MRKMVMSVHKLSLTATEVYMQLLVKSYYLKRLLQERSEMVADFSNS